MLGRGLHGKPCGPASQISESLKSQIGNEEEHEEEDEEEEHEDGEEEEESADETRIKKRPALAMPTDDEVGTALMEKPCMDAGAKMVVKDCPVVKKMVVDDFDAKKSGYRYGKG